MAYYQIDWDAIHRLPARQQLEVLADIAATVPALVAQERVRVVGRTVERHAAERPWGAQSRAAAELGLTKSRVGQLWSEYKERAMATTTYGTINTMVPAAGTATNLHDYVASALGDYADDYDIDAITADYRDAINEHLAPHGITLAGDEFHGPYPRPENAAEVIAEAGEDVDLWEIVARHDTAA